MVQLPRDAAEVGSLDVPLDDEVQRVRLEGAELRPQRLEGGCLVLLLVLSGPQDPFCRVLQCCSRIRGG